MFHTLAETQPMRKRTSPKDGIMWYQIDMRFVFFFWLHAHKICDISKLFIVTSKQSGYLYPLNYLLTLFSATLKLFLLAVILQLYQFWDLFWNLCLLLLSEIHVFLL